MLENKNSYFYLDMRLPYDRKESSVYQDQLKNSVDLVLASMGVEEDPEEFCKIDKTRIIYLFKTSKRKRKGQLIKFCKRFLDDTIEYTAEGISKSGLSEQLVKLTKSDKYNKKDINTIKYNGDDIKILDDRKNWKPWQTEIFKKFFNEDLSFKKPQERIIYSLVDIEGQSGKSIFYKWLLVHIGENDIGKITFGTASQLRSSVINMGTKKMYILDLTRTKGRDDSEFDLMSALESVVDGMIVSPMYGRAATLLMEPPHILITSNYLLDYELLSMDRWRVYEIKKNGTLGIENEIFKYPEKRKDILRQQNQKRLERLEAKKF